MKNIQNVCFLRNDGKILLGMKKRGFGAGRWNGFGGKLQEGETIEEAAKRETREESGMEIQEMEKFGIIDFAFQSKEDILEVHFFEIKKYSGEAQETEEMKPQWFAYSEIPLKEMWPDDKFWMPLFLEGKKFQGAFYFDEAENRILKNNLEIVENI